MMRGQPISVSCKSMPGTERLRALGTKCIDGAIGRPAPVALVLPEDILTETTGVRDIPAWKQIQTHPGQQDIVRVTEALQTAERPLIIIGGNGRNEEARGHQESFAVDWELPVATRVVATELVNPDFIALAKAYGAHAGCVTETEQFVEALQRAQAAGKPALIEVRIDKEVISPNTTISALRN